MNKEFNRFGDPRAHRKIVLRITKGPTNAAIEFHCDGDYATRTVQVALNSTEDYIGGRLCFYVKCHLHVLNERPMGSIVMHPRQVLHAVTNLEKGRRCSLFVVDELNGKYDKEVFEVTKKEVEMYLEAIEKETVAIKNIEIQVRVETKIEIKNTPNEPQGKKEKNNCCIS